MRSRRSCPARRSTPRPPYPAGAAGCSSTARRSAGIAALKALPVPADVVERMDAVADFAYRADGSPTPLGAAALRGRRAARRRPRAARAAGRPVVPALDRDRAAARRHAPRGARRVSADRRRPRRRGRRRSARSRWQPLEPLLVRALGGRASSSRAWTLRITARPLVVARLGARLRRRRAALRRDARADPALLLAFALVGTDARSTSATASSPTASPIRSPSPGSSSARRCALSDLPELGLAAFGAGGFLLHRGAALALGPRHGRRQARVRARALPRAAR